MRERHFAPRPSNFCGLGDVLMTLLAGALLGLPVAFILWLSSLPMLSLLRLLGASGDDVFFVLWIAGVSCPVFVPFLLVGLTLVRPRRWHGRQDAQCTSGLGDPRPPA